MPTFAITGAAGYLGTRMTRHLLDADPDNRVVGIDVRPGHIEDPRFELHTLDVRDRRLGELLERRDVRSLLHFAFIVDPFYDEAEMHDIDVRGTRNVLEAALVAGVPHLVALSSTTAYGALPDNPVPLTESAPPRARPSFAYAHDKRLMDEMLGDFARTHAEIALATLRPCIVLGPHVANYIAALILRQPVTALLDGADPPFQFVHEDDVVRLVAAVVERKAAGVWNAVGTGTVTRSELSALQRKPVLRLPYGAGFGLAWAIHRLRLLPFAASPGILDFFRYPWVASGEKAERELGFRAAHSTRDCFESILERKEAIVAAFDRQMTMRGKR